MSQSKLMNELMKRDRKLQALVSQRELTQGEKDDWEQLAQQITALQEEMQSEAE